MGEGGRRMEGGTAQAGDKHVSMIYSFLVLIFFWVLRKGSDLGIYI